MELKSSTVYSLNLQCVLFYRVISIGLAGNLPLTLGEIQIIIAFI